MVFIALLLIVAGVILIALNRAAGLAVFAAGLALLLVAAIATPDTTFR